MSHDVQSAPDIAFFRNIGITLLALTVAVGAISVIGCLKTSETSMLAQSLEGNTTASGASILKVDIIGL